MVVTGACMLLPFLLSNCQLPIGTSALAHSTVNGANLNGAASFAGEWDGNGYGRILSRMVSARFLRS
jgi:hypothetical protein